MNQSEQLKIAILKLENHKLILYKDDTFYISDKRGIVPMIDYLNQRLDLRGFYAADVIVGKAVASLFIKAGIKEVYGEVMSIAASKLLSKHHIPHFYNTLVEKIINRDNTGVCPMEETIKDVDDIEQCFFLLVNRINELRNK